MTCSLQNRSKTKRLLRGGFWTLGGLLTAVLVLAWMVAGALVAPCPCEIGEPPADLRAVPFAAASESGSVVQGWHCRAESSRGVVVLLHGIRGSRLAMLGRARLLHELGYSTVMIDLQAHGESPGERITIGHLERHDARAAVEFARREHPGEPIGVIGVSLGGAAAALASPLAIDALVLEAVYPDINAAVHNRVAAQLGPLASLPAELLLLQLEPRLGVSPDQLRPIDHLPGAGCPVLVISGTADAHTTVAETQAMFAAAPEPKELWLVEGAAHVDLHHLAPLEYRQRLGDFLARHLNGPSEQVTRREKD